MKKPYTLLVFFVLICSTMSWGANKRFFITTIANNKQASSYLDFFESKVFNGLMKNFPCVEINSLSTVVALLDLERQKQLLGAGDENAIENIGGAMGSDYLICLKVNVLNGTAIVEAFCADTRRIKVISRASATGLHGDAGIDAVEKVSEQLLEGLKQYEICPFIGPVSITINSVKDSTHTIEYGVYCNEMDQRFHQVIEIHNNTFSEWKLQRTGVATSEGNMSFSSNELSKITEENGCYACKTGREGGRTYSETKTMKVKGSGISHESVRNGKPQDDTWIELKFLENGTYLLIAKGTSQPAKGEDKVVTSAVGTCDNIPQNTKLEPREISIPLKVIFGPYSGKTTDKILQQKETKKTIDPVTKEQTTITIDFSLTMKGK